MNGYNGRKSSGRIDRRSLLKQVKGVDNDDTHARMSKTPYITKSGHVRYARRYRNKNLPHDFNSWVLVFESNAFENL